MHCAGSTVFRATWSGQASTVSRATWSGQARPCFEMATTGVTGPQCLGLGSDVLTTMPQCPKE